MNARMKPHNMEILNFFKQIIPISPKAKCALEAIVRKEVYVKNELIQNIGSRCSTIYILLSGGARIFYYKGGKDITEHFAFSNEMIVRAESLLTGRVTSKGIQAIDDVELVAIDASQLFKLYDEYHEIERLFRLIFEREYVNALRRMESFQFMSAKERYLELLETTNYVHTIPLKYIASYLGVTQVTLSRIRADIRYF